MELEASPQPSDAPPHAPPPQALMSNRAAPGDAAEAAAAASAAAAGGRVISLEVRGVAGGRTRLGKGGGERQGRAEIGLFDSIVSVFFFDVEIVPIAR